MEKHIIHADDDDDMLDMVKFFVEQACPDACVHSYDNSKMALEEFEYSKDSTDLIITDYNLPPFNGYDFAVKAKKVKDVPIILFSGNPIITDEGSYGPFTFSVSKSNPALLQEVLAKFFKTS